MSFNHKSPSGVVHKNEGWTLTFEGVLLFLVLLAMGLMGTGKTFGASFMGWGAAVMALIFADFVGQFYSMRPNGGRYDLVGAFMLLGVVIGTAVEFFYPEGQAIVNSSFNYSVLGILAEFLIILTLGIWAILIFWAAERKAFY